MILQMNWQCNVLRLTGVTASLLVVSLAFISTAMARTVVVANTGGSISIIKSIDGIHTLVGIVPTPERAPATSVAITPDGRYAYVSLPALREIAQFDIRAGSFGARINVGDATGGIAISPDGSRVYVTHPVVDAFSVIDTDPSSDTVDTVIAAIDHDIGDRPAAVAVTPDSSKILIVNTGSGEINVFDSTDYRHITDFRGVPRAGPRWPSSISVTPDSSRAYVPEADGYVWSIRLSDGDDELIDTGPAGADDSGDSYAALGWLQSHDGRSSSGGLVVAHDSFETVSFMDIPSVGDSLLTLGITFASGARGVAASPISETSLYSGETPIAWVANSGSTHLSYLWWNPAARDWELSSIDAGDDGPNDVAVVPNQAPRAEFSYRRADMSVGFDAGASRDPDGEIEHYNWDFGDGETLSTTRPRVVHTYASRREYSVTLTVWDNEGASTERIFTGRTVTQNGSDGAYIKRVVSTEEEPPDPPAPPPPPHGDPLSDPVVASPTSTLPIGQPGPSNASSYKQACNLRVTTPKMKGAGKNSQSLTVSRKNARRLFTHGAKGYVRWGKVEGKQVKCKKLRMVLLEKRGKRYFVPGTKRRVFKKNVLPGHFIKTAADLKRKGVGKLRKKNVDSKRWTKFSFKDFNRKSKLGKRALNRLGSKRYKGIFYFFLTAEIDGKKIVKKVKMRTGAV